MMAISKDKIKQVIVKVLESKTEDVVKVVVNNTIRWAADSNPPVTWESFWNELKNQFSVNEMFWTLVESKMEFKKTKNVHLKW
jgi:hypothetical protein